MRPDASYEDVILELRDLTAEYVEMKALAHEAEARGYEALFASVSVADQAARLCRRAVQALERATFLLLPIDEARETRRQLLRTSRALASLVGGTPTLDPAHRRPAKPLRTQHLLLRDLLRELDRAPRGERDGSLHRRLLAAAAAADASLRAWKPS